MAFFCLASALRHCCTFGALLLHFYFTEYKEGQKTLGDVYEMVCNCSETMLESLFNALPPDHPAKSPFALYQKNAGNDKVCGGVIMDLGTRLGLLQSKIIRRLLGHNDIRLDLPAHEKCAYFIRISDQHGTFQFLSSLMFSFLFTDIIEYADTHGRVCPVPVNFILDEFPNIGEIPDFTKKLSTVRSRRVNIDVIFQSIPQLKNRYQLDQWREILDDCDTSIFLGGNGDMTTEYVAKQTGEISVKVDTEARELNLFRVTDATRQFKKSEGLGRRQLLTTDEVRRLAFDEEICIIRGQKPLMLNKFDYSLNPDSKKLREIRITDYTPNWPAPRRAVRDFKPTPKPAASNPPPAGGKNTAAPASNSARPDNPAGASHTPEKDVTEPPVTSQTKPHRGRRKSTPKPTASNPPSAGGKNTAAPASSSARPDNPAGASHIPAKEVIEPPVTSQTKPHRGRRKSTPTPGQQTLLDFPKPKPSPQPPQGDTTVDGFEHKDPSEL